MSASGVRLVVPGGEAYRSALVEGAAKVAARRKVPPGPCDDFVAAVTTALEHLGAASPAAVEMTIDAQPDRIDVSLTARSPAEPLDEAAITAIDALASELIVDPRFDPATAAITFSFTPPAART